MALKLEIYLPTATVDDFELIEDLCSDIGDILGEKFGNTQPEGDFALDSLNSFIIIKDDELPAPENFPDQDMYFVIPIGK